jgi:hypothetical protein
MKLRSKVAALMGAGVLVLGVAGTTFAAGPGDNGSTASGNGTTSDATVDSSLADAGSSATMGQDAVMVCDGDNVGSVSGEFTLSKDLDSGSKITIYLFPNNGSNADPAVVSKNEVTVTLDSSDDASGSVVPFTVNITNAFTADTGGILAVFAVNADNTTVISSSKSNSLNCSEASSSSSSSSETSSTSSSTSFTGSQSGETDVPSQPNTATIGDSSSGPSNGAWLLVAALGALVGSIVVLTPARAKNRR